METIAPKILFSSHRLDHGAKRLFAGTHVLLVTCVILGTQ